MGKFREISVVIPVYRGEKTILPTLERTEQYLKENFSKYEIIVVVDSSGDRTEGIVKKKVGKGIRMISNPKRVGKGRAVRQGVMEARYDFVAFMDSGLPFPISELGKFMGRIRGYDMLIGSRTHKDSRAERTRLRKFLSNVYNALAGMLLNTGFRDSQCGLKMFKKNAAREIFSKARIDGYSFDTEMIVIAKENGYKIGELPIAWAEKENSTLNLKRDSVKMMLEVLKIMGLKSLGRYRTKN